MGIFSRKIFQGHALSSHFLISALLTSLLVACGDDSSSSPDLSGKDTELSSEADDAKSSSSSVSKKTSSSSVSDKKSSSSSSDDDEVEDGLDVIYSVWDGNVSGVVGLDSYTSAKNVKMVELDSADDYDETKNVFSAEIDKNGAYEFKKVNLVQPFVQVSAEVT